MTDKETVAVADSQLRDYELVLIVKPDVEEEALNARIESLSKLVTGGGGNVSSVERWGKRRLAYPIKHFMEGSYVFTQLKIKPATSKELEANLRILEDVLRYLLIKVTR